MNRLRDRIGQYTAHVRLENTETGQKILDHATRLQAALGDAFSARDSKDWEDAAGFRSAGDVRKLRSGECIGTMTDLAVLVELAPDEFTGFAEVVARLAGGRFEPLKDSDRALADSVARLGVNAAELSAEVMTSSAPTSEGGAAITGPEKVRLRKRLVRLKNFVAEAESALDSDEQPRTRS